MSGISERYNIIYSKGYYQFQKRFFSKNGKEGLKPLKTYALLETAVGELVKAGEVESEIVEAYKQAKHFYMLPSKANTTHL